MRWCGKARLRLEHNLRHPDKPLCLAAVGRIVQWGIEAGRIKPEGIGEATPARSGARAAPRPSDGADSRAATPSTGAERPGAKSSKWTT